MLPGCGTIMGRIFLILCLQFFIFAAPSRGQPRTKCYDSHCYMLLEEGKAYDSRASCPPPFTELEIYDKKMNDDVENFAKEIQAKPNYVELKMKCRWEKSNKIVTYSNWIATSDNNVPGILLGIRHSWVYSPMRNYFSTVCMKKRDDSRLADGKRVEDATTRNHISGRETESQSERETLELDSVTDNQNDPCAKNDWKMKLMLFAIISGAIHVMSIAVIVALATALKQKSRKRKFGLKHGDENVAEKDIEKNESHGCTLAKRESENMARSKHAKQDDEFDDDMSDYANLNQIK